MMESLLNAKNTNSEMGSLPYLVSKATIWHPWIGARSLRACDRPVWASQVLWIYTCTTVLVDLTYFHGDSWLVGYG